MPAYYQKVEESFLGAAFNLINQCCFSKVEDSKVVVVASLRQLRAKTVYRLRLQRKTNNYFRLNITMQPHYKQ